MAVTYVVLWRGEAGWMGNGNSRTVPSSTGTSRRVIGSHVLEVAVDSAMNSATVAGTTVDLRHTNAIFVDGVDRASAAKVVDTQFVGVQPPKTARNSEWSRSVLQGLPTLAAFAGCESAARRPEGGYCAQLNLSPR